MENKKPPDPGSIMQMATAYWAPATLFAAIELDLFGLIGDEALTASAAAARTGAGERGVTMLLDACAGLGLILKEMPEREGGQPLYRNSPGSEAYLNPARPGYLGGAIRWSADQYAAWGDLGTCIRQGRPAVSPSLHLGADLNQTRNFVVGMHQRALGVARGVIPFLPMEGVTRLLDVGGGPGTYSALLARQYPRLTSDVMDLPAVAAIAEELLADAGVGERVRLRPGDATRDDYGIELYDGVLFSGVLHQMSPTTIQAMMARSFGALKPGGTVWVSDVMLDTSKTQPAFSTLFSLQMLLTSDEGAVFSSQECVEWLAGCGFIGVTAQPLPPPLPYVVVTGRKP